MILISFPHNPTTHCVDLQFFRDIVGAGGAARHHDRARFRLCRPGLRRLPAAQHPASGGRQGNRGRNLLHVEELQHGGLARGLLPGESENDRGARRASRAISITASSSRSRSLPSSRCASAPRTPRRSARLPEAPRRAGRRVWTAPAGRWNRRGAPMFVWAPIPERIARMGSLEFSKLLMEKALVAVSPGIGFGPLGEGYVRFALIENEHRTAAGHQVDPAVPEELTPRRRLVRAQSLLLWEQARGYPRVQIVEPLVEQHQQHFPHAGVGRLPDARQSSAVRSRAASSAGYPYAPVLMAGKLTVRLPCFSARSRHAAVTTRQLFRFAVPAVAIHRSRRREKHTVREARRPWSQPRCR